MNITCHLFTFFGNFSFFLVTVFRNRRNCFKFVIFCSFTFRDSICWTLNFGNFRLILVTVFRLILVTIFRLILVTIFRNRRNCFKFVIFCSFTFRDSICQTFNFGNFRLILVTVFRNILVTVFRLILVTVFRNRRNCFKFVIFCSFTFRDSICRTFNFGNFRLILVTIFRNILVTVFRLILVTIFRNRRNCFKFVIFCSFTFRDSICQTFNFGNFRLILVTVFRNRRNCFKYIIICSFTFMNRICQTWVRNITLFPTFCFGIRNWRFRITFNFITFFSVCYRTENPVVTSSLDLSL